MVIAPNVRVVEVTLANCLKAIELSKEYEIGFSDSIACAVMEELGISEIYSSDRNFDRVPGISRVID